MRLTIPQINLAALIVRGAAAAAKKSPIPVLEMVRLTASGDELALASSDQDRFAEAITPATIAEEGSVCVNAAALDTLIKKHPKSGVISMALDGDRLVVTCGRSKVKLPTLKPDIFPTWADGAPVSSFEMDGKDFKRALSRVRFAAASDDVRYNLQGVHLDADEGNLHFVATDGHRLAVSGLAMPDGAENCPPVIVPSEGVDAALKMFDGAASVALAVNERAISFSADGLRLSSRLIEGVFPDYSRIIPARGNPSITCKRADFVDCLDRANVLVGEGALSSIIARPDGDTLRLEARNNNGGEAMEELAATTSEGMGPFGFNPRYAAQFLATLNVRELTFEHAGGMGFVLIHSDDAPDFVGVLAPTAVAG